MTRHPASTGLLTVVLVDRGPPPDVFHVDARYTAWGAQVEHADAAIRYACHDHRTEVGRDPTLVVASVHPSGLLTLRISSERAPLDPLRLGPLYRSNVTIEVCRQPSPPPRPGAG